MALSASCRHSIAYSNIHRRMCFSSVLCIPLCPSREQRNSNDRTSAWFDIRVPFEYNMQSSLSGGSVEHQSTIRGILASSERLLLPKRRHAWTTLALLLLVVLGLAEPLACLTHCRTMVQFEVRRAFVEQHQASTRNADRFEVTGDRARDLLHVRLVVLSNLFVCFVDIAHGDQSGLPFAPSPEAFHDHQATIFAAVLLALILLIQRRSIARVHAPPPHTSHPPLRPPIALAA